MAEYSTEKPDWTTGGTQAYAQRTLRFLVTQSETHCFILHLQYAFFTCATADYTPFALTRPSRGSLRVLRKTFLSAEGCCCRAEGRGRFTFWLRSIRLLPGLRGGISAVSCGSLRGCRTAAWTAYVWRGMSLTCNSRRVSGQRIAFERLYDVPPKSRNAIVFQSAQCPLKVRGIGRWSRRMWSSIARHRVRRI